MPKRIQRRRVKGWKMPPLTIALNDGILQSCHGARGLALALSYVCSVIGISISSRRVRASAMRNTIGADEPATMLIAGRDVRLIRRFVPLLQKRDGLMRLVNTARGAQNSSLGLGANAHRVRNAIQLSWKFITAMAKAGPKESVLGGNISSTCLVFPCAS
jgi:hypothetical protein